MSDHENDPLSPEDAKRRMAELRAAAATIAATGATLRLELTPDEVLMLATAIGFYIDWIDVASMMSPESGISEETLDAILADVEVFERLARKLAPMLAWMRSEVT